MALIPSMVGNSLLEDVVCVFSSEALLNGWKLELEELLYESVKVMVRERGVLRFNLNFIFLWVPQIQRDIVSIYVSQFFYDNGKLWYPSKVHLYDKCISSWISTTAHNLNQFLYVGDLAMDIYVFAWPGLISTEEKLCLTDFSTFHNNLPRYSANLIQNYQ